MTKESDFTEVKLMYAKSDDELKRSFGKLSYGGVAYNNCSQLLNEFYELLYRKNNVSHGNKIFVQLDPKFTQTDIDPETKEEVLTFSGASPIENESTDGRIIFKVKESEDRNSLLRHRKPYITVLRMLKDKFSLKDKGHECWYNLSMCDEYKESFERRTGKHTCPVKWFYEHHFNFSRPFYPQACVVDRALNGEPIQKWELETFHTLPIVMSPTTPHCASFTPNFRDANDSKRFAFDMKNYEYLIELENLNQKEDIVLYGF